MYILRSFLFLMKTSQQIVGQKKISYKSRFMDFKEKGTHGNCHLSSKVVGIGAKNTYHHL